MEKLHELSSYFNGIANDYISSQNNRRIIENIWNNIKHISAPKGKNEEIFILEMEAEGFFEILKNAFLEKHNINDKVIFNQEYNRLKPFFTKAEEYPKIEALKHENKDENAIIEYIRLKDARYYQSNKIDTTLVFPRRELIRYTIIIYIYWYEWIEQQRNRLNNKKPTYIYNGFRTKLNNNQLKHLHKLLVNPKNSFFDPDTSEENFFKHI